MIVEAFATQGKDIVVMLSQRDRPNPSRYGGLDKALTITVINSSGQNAMIFSLSETETQELIDMLTKAKKQTFRSADYADNI